MNIDPQKSSENKDAEINVDDLLAEDDSSSEEKSLKKEVKEFDENDSIDEDERQALLAELEASDS